MWWSDRARGLAALALALSLGGCFQPLYSEAAHPGLVADLQAIEVAPIKDRIGHYLGDDLISSFNGTGSTPTAKYRLNVTLTRKIDTPTIESQVNVADAATVIGTAKFSLVQLEGDTAEKADKVVFQGEATTAAVYDRTLQGFANLRAERDADIRIARALADEISLRVAAALGAKS
jgi:LPS-assembly lipoprotein